MGVVARRVNPGEGKPTPKPRGRPASTPEGRENQLIAAAEALAEKQLLEGTASSQVITHYLKLGSPREQLERRKLAGEILLLETKAEDISSKARTEEMYREAMNAFASYAGNEPPEDFGV